MQFARSIQHVIKLVSGLHLALRPHIRFHLPTASCSPWIFFVLDSGHLPTAILSVWLLILPLAIILLTVVVVFRLFSLLSFRLRPWLPASDCGAPGALMTPPTPSWMGHIEELETTNWLATFMSSASDVKSLRSSLCFNIESARHPSVKYWMAWISWTPSHEFFSLIHRDR